MITEILVKLDKTKRRRVIILAVLVIGCVCYFAITRGSLAKLQQAKAKQIGLQFTHAGTQKQIINLTTLQKTLNRIKQQLDEQRQECFDGKQASKFFENINSMAISHSLKPISLMNFESAKLGRDKNAGMKQKFLAIQSASISVDGGYFDIINFLEELTNRPQKVSIKNLNISLVNKKASKPRATFNIVVLVNSSENNKKQQAY